MSQGGADEPGSLPAWNGNMAGIVFQTLRDVNNRKARAVFRPGFSDRLPVGNESLSAIQCHDLYFHLDGERFTIMVTVPKGYNFVLRRGSAYPAFGFG